MKQNNDTFQRIKRAFAYVGITWSDAARFDRSHGGDINESFVVSDGSQRYFVKDHANAAVMFAKEARSLVALSEQGHLNTPAVIGTYTEDQSGCLILQYIDMQRLSSDGFFQAGVHLARCHQATHDAFGWPENNTIGTTLQVNTWTAEWVDFFLEHRLGVQLDLLNNRTLNPYRKKLDGLRSRFEHYSPAASLLHGDLWSGNVAADHQGTPVFFDPACYYGDRETDLAMTELFGGFPQSFYQGYHSVWPLHTGYTQRKPVYQLYHILNHANLFGHGYVSQAQRLLDDLLA